MPRSKVTEVPGVVDVIYEIEEGDPYLLGEFRVTGNKPTQDKVVRREAVMAGLLPGELLDLNRVESFKKRLTGTRIVPGCSRAPNREATRSMSPSSTSGQGTSRTSTGRSPTPRPGGVTRMQNPVDAPAIEEPPGGGLGPSRGEA